MNPETLLYLRDATFFRVGSRNGGKWHLPGGRDCRSKCGRARMLDEENPTPMRAVPPICLCAACFPDRPRR